MNPVKKILVNFKKTRSVYDPHNINLKKKYNPSIVKEQMRLQRRMKKINAYDDEITKEPPIEAVNNAKAQVIQKMLTEFQNTHRLSRKAMPQAEKEEYIRKCKEFSLYRNHIWRKQRDEIIKNLDAEKEMMKSIVMLPIPMMEELYDLENIYEDEGEEEEGNILDPTEYTSKTKPKDRDDENYEDLAEEWRMKGREYLEPKEEVWKENSEDLEALEFNQEFLYLPQLLKIFPDDYHIVHKTLINLSAYESAKQGGTDMGDVNPGAGGEDDRD